MLTQGEETVSGDAAVAMCPKKHIDCRIRGQFLAEMSARWSKAHTEGNMGRDGVEHEGGVRKTSRVWS